MGRPPFESEHVLVVRSHRWVAGLWAVPLLAVFLFGLLLEGWLSLLSLLSVPVLLVPFALAWHRSNVQEESRVRADAKGLTIGGRIVRRAELRAALALPGDPPRVLLRRRGLRFPIELQMDTMKQARRLLRALGLDASHRVIDLKVDSLALPRIQRNIWVTSLGLMLSVWLALQVGRRISDFAGALAMGALLTIVAILVFMPTRLRVGADGIGLRWLSRWRLLDYGAIASVVLTRTGSEGPSSGFCITLHSGESVWLLVGEGNLLLLDERIRAAVHAFRKSGEVANAALLRRGARGLGEWVTMLRALGAGANANMRTAPISRELLLGILEDPAAAAADRAAAAIALGHDADTETRVRLRVAAESTVSSKLRVAIETVADDESETQIEAALAELEEDEPTARAS